MGEDGCLVPQAGDPAHQKVFECFQAAGIDIAPCDDADIILMTLRLGERFAFDRRVLRSAFYKRYRDKIVAYSVYDLRYPRIPGVYTSATPLWVSVGWVRAGHYLASYIPSHQFDWRRRPRDLLFSFVGSSRTSPVRGQILALRHDRSCLVDVASDPTGPHWWQHSRERVQESKERFKDVMERTKFAICPRGVDASSIRIFEAMQAGCVPVIVSDRIVLPDGPHWDRFSLRVRERAVAHIPALLAEHEGRFEEMSVLARDAWEQWFSDAATVRSLVHWGSDILRHLPPGKRRSLAFLNWLGTWVLPPRENAAQRLYMAAVTAAPRGLKDRVKRILRRG